MALLFGVGVVIFSGLGSEGRSPGLDGDFSRASDSYRDALERFTIEVRELGEDAELSEALRVYGNMRSSLIATRSAYQELDTPAEMQTAKRALITSLDEQLAALERAMEASRRGDAPGSNLAREQFLGAALVYQRARLQMESLIEQCGERCR
ncbi:MAG: hypothetical protein KY429_02255 [Actinobacteria bacterium]|nr:hypothetical protein [Actinomycetota bacterium]